MTHFIQNTRPRQSPQSLKNHQVWLMVIGCLMGAIFGFVVSALQTITLFITVEKAPSQIITAQAGVSAFARSIQHSCPRAVLPQGASPLGSAQSQSPPSLPVVFGITGALCLIGAALFQIFKPTKNFLPVPPLMNAVVVPNPNEFVQLVTNMASSQTSIAMMTVASGQFDFDESRLIEALRNGEYQEQVLPSGCIIYTLEDDSIPWLYQNKNEPLFVRPSTQEIYKKIMATERNVLLTGNPGIGKTWFHNYFLLQWILSMKHDDILVLDKRDNASVAVVVKKGEPAVFIAGQELLFFLKNPKVTYLVDTGGMTANEPFMCNGRTILTSYPAQRHYKSFMTYRQPIRLYYAPWSLAELLEVKPKTMKTKEVKKRFSMVGGIPRHVFANDEEFRLYLNAVDSAIKKMDWVNPEPWSEGDQLELTNRIFVHIPGPEYANFRTDFASKEIDDKVFKYLSELDQSLLKRFMEVTQRETMLSTLWGSLYERSFFSHLTKLSRAKKAFRVQLKRLHRPSKGKSPSAQMEVRVPEVKYLNLKVKDVILTLDMEAQVRKHAGSLNAMAIYPNIENYRTIDGLILDGSTIYGIQVTKNKTHSAAKPGLEKLEEFKQILLKKYDEVSVILVMVHLANVKFNLTDEGWNNLDWFPETKVYEAEWEPPQLKSPRRPSSADEDHPAAPLE